MKTWIAAGSMLFGLTLLAAGAGVHRTAPLVSHQVLDPSLHALEEAAARNPNDARKLTDLCNAYLDRRVPGMAIAAIRHAPTEVQAEPVVQYFMGRSLLRSGQSDEALAVHRTTIQTCETKGCDEWVYGGAKRQEAFLSELVSSNIKSPEVSDAETYEAYRRAGLDQGLVALAR